MNSETKEINFPGQTGFYSGKVRDVYHLGDDILVIVASDRISAFDVILPRTIPYKGQVLNQIAAYFLQKTAYIVPNWLLDVPLPNVSAGIKCNPFKIEVVVRAYLAGHAWRTYKSGQRKLCGVDLPEGLKENDKLPTPIITPSTKADEGHDEDITADEILKRKLCTPEEWAYISEKSLQLFAKGTEIAAAQGLILVDTKYEFGKYQDKIYLIDEVHTPDSSRYFYADTYAKNQQKEVAQKQLSKEFVRQWLIEKGFQGKEGQTIPEMTDAFIELVSERYIHLYEQITGHKFEKSDPFSSQKVVETIHEKLPVYKDQLKKM